MRSSATCCPHSKPQNFGIPKIALDGKLEFVEHVLGVLIESRFGPGHGYTTLGEAPVTTGHSQMFANVRLLTEAEIEAHLKFGGVRHEPFYWAFLRELPLALANGNSKSPERPYFAAPRFTDISRRSCFASSFAHLANFV
jgi:hypothetical protein